MHRSIGIIFLLALATAISGCSFSLVGDVTPPPGAELAAPQEATQTYTYNSVFPLVPPDLANGKKLYEQECIQCHGEKGLGDGPQAAQLSVPVAALGLSDYARQFSPVEWYNVVAHGNMERFMPAFPNLTDRERWDVVAYSMSLSASNKTISQGKALYESKCASCHGISGNGKGANAGALAAAPSSFTDQSFMAKESSSDLYQAVSEGVSPDMPAFGSSLDDNQRWAVVSYLRSLAYTAAPAGEEAAPNPTASGVTQPASFSSPEAQAYPSPALSETPAITSTAAVTSTAPFYGSVTVQLVNGSGGEAPSDAPVTLYGFDSMQNTYSETLSTGENGVYTFTNVIMPQGRVFLAGTDYASGTYGSDIVTVDPAKPDLSLQITVYDSTSDVSALTTDRVHVFFDFSNPPNVQVLEVFIISNPTKQAVVSTSPDGTVVTFPLPEGYTNLQFQDGDLGGRYVQMSQGFGDKMTVRPGTGEYQVVFAFQMPYDHKLDFSQAMFLPTSAVVVMVPDNGVKVSSSMLKDGGTQQYQNTTYRLYNGSSLLAGSSLDFSLSGTPRQSAASIFGPETGQNLAVGLGVFGVALVLAGVWLYRRNRLKLAVQRAASGSGMPDSLSGMDYSPENEETLMDAIISLDDQFHAGNIPEDAYLERRAALKETLRKMEQG